VPAAPRELAQARQEYRRAASGAAGTYDTAQLRVAKLALDRAEAAYRDDSKDAPDYAYVATRDAQIAEAHGNTVVAMLERDKVRDEVGVAEKQRADEAEARVQQLEQERKTPRTQIVSLPGALFFAPGQTEVAPAARAQLDRAAAQLEKIDQATIVVLGFSDNAGTPAYGQDMSQRRADAVRDYLTSRGVPADRIQTRAMGSQQPLGDNRTPEGRAMNRRAEIQVNLPPGTTGAAEEQPAQP
jgi:outer membrane protein OmpA-like peptidoglycan-associated protein